MKSKIFIIDCLTNMHVGSGDYNISVIDNLVSKDVNNFMPNINGSGVKGAIREFFDFSLNISDEKSSRMFGGQRRETQDDSSLNVSKKTIPVFEGKLKFLSANLLARPMRTSSGKKSHYLITTNEIINNFNYLNTTILGENDFYLSNIITVDEEIFVEGVNISKKLKFLDKDLFFMNEEVFNNIELPVIARNEVKKEVKNSSGETINTRGNLWYEEIVPYNSVFYFYVLCNDNDEELLNEFSVLINDKIVQFGANASVGYGYCKVSELKEVNYDR